MEQIIPTLEVFWQILPEIWLKALVVFVAVGLLKLSGVLKEDIQAQFGNIAVTWFLTGGATDIVGFSMTAVVAGLYYHIWKLVKPYLAKLFDLVKQKLQPAG